MIIRRHFTSKEEYYWSITCIKEEKVNNGETVRVTNSKLNTKIKQFKIWTKKWNNDTQNASEIKTENYETFKLLKKHEIRLRHS